jgi:hypothetical protein
VPTATCPRCGANRPDEFRWCRKCGLDFNASTKGVVPDRAPANTSESTPVSPPPVGRMDVRQVNDRANMARYARDVVDIRCLGTIGGIVGALVGFLVFGWIGIAIGGVGAGARLSWHRVRLVVGGPDRPWSPGTMIPSCARTHRAACTQ